ncbi:hypothetical protein [Dyella flagellata]|uniref:Uncharacterized protein n=1 Tax=Dyella flagellata TaxID=1867833 RepID=A0ABQ5XAI5_9GAMM|nr:hypothetical protein [Dyella flagellata]GLQ88186.1 hypothetical protein GCM10007898_17550 [Dyella flagellata]
MPPTMYDLPPSHMDQANETRRVSSEPVEGYVLDPWSGLYMETEVTFKSRVAPQEPA